MRLHFVVLKMWVTIPIPTSYNIVNFQFQMAVVEKIEALSVDTRRALNLEVRIKEKYVPDFDFPGLFYSNQISVPNSTPSLFLPIRP